jgi:hypothetical protein
MKENITWVNRGVLVTLSEQLDGDELFQVNEKVYSDSRFDNLLYQLWDFTKVTELNINIEDIIKIAAHDKAAALSNSSLKVATVATEEVMQTLLSLYQAEMFTSPWESQMFNSVDEAQQWVL